MLDLIYKGLDLLLDLFHLFEFPVSLKFDVLLPERGDFLLMFLNPHLLHGNIKLKAVYLVGQSLDKPLIILGFVIYQLFFKFLCLLILVKKFNFQFLMLFV